MQLFDSVYEALPIFAMCDNRSIRFGFFGPGLFFVCVKV